MYQLVNNSNLCAIYCLLKHLHLENFDNEPDTYSVCRVHT